MRGFTKIKHPKSTSTARQRKQTGAGIAGIKRFLSILGPGLITGASDDDPSGIGTYAQAGARLGFAPLWTALFTFPLMAVIQYVCAKIGLVTGHGLAGLLRRHFSRTVLYFAVCALVVANTLNAGADIGAIAEAIHLLLPQIPVMVAIVFSALLIIAFLMFGSYRLIANVFKWLTLSLFAYIGSAFFVHADFKEILRHTLWPDFRWNSQYLAILVGILGTTISPYLFFWQSDIEVEQAKAENPDEAQRLTRSRFWRKRSRREELKYATLDVCTGMFFSNLVMYFIIFTTGATLHQSGITHIDTAEQAAAALRPIAGGFASAIFAIGLIGTGVLAVPILTGSAAYATSQAFGWKYGLEKRPQQAKKFYAFIAISTLVGMMINFVGVSAMTALFWTAVVNGFLAVPMLVMIMLIASNKNIMGVKVIAKPTAVVGWLTVVAMFAAAIGLIWTSWNP